MRVIALFMALACSIVSNAQITIYSEDFESGGSFASSGDLTQNDWIVSTCAGNGPGSPGTSSLYITQGGSTPDCSSTGITQYTFANSLSGSVSAIAHVNMDAACISAIEVSFDYAINTDNTNDFAELVYSTDGGSSWIPVGGILPNSTGWTSTSISLPGSLDYGTFELGFRFTYDDSNNATDPLAIDNITVSGIDAIDPVLVCELNATLVMSNDCEAIVGDFSKDAITVSDNCTDSTDMSYIYNPLPGTVLSASVGDLFVFQLTAVDESGNQSNTCSINIEVVDETQPVFDYCPTDTNLYLDATCSAVLPDYLLDISATDNCSPGLTYSQSPVAGTTINGIATTAVTIEVEDPSGNTNQCVFNVMTVDTIVSTITCPPNQNMYANASCQATLVDFTGMATVSDNCTPSGSLTVTQSPVSGTVISANQVITLEVSGGTPATPQQCTFTVQFIDTIKPTISCPVIATQYYDNNCERIINDFTGGIIWSDNCESSLSNMTVVQTPTPGTLTQNNTPIVIDITDPSGNTASCTTNFNLVDTISPTVGCPSNQPLSSGPACTANLPSYIPMATGSDNCTTSGILIYSQSPAIGSVISSNTTITITVEDASGNQGNCQFDVTLIDNAFPDIVCPTSTTVSADAGCTYSLADLSGIVSASDNCTPSGNLVFSQSPVVNTVLPAGTTAVTITVEDATGNSNACDVDVIVIDDTAPVFSTCPSGMSAFTNASCEGVIGDYSSDVVYSDNCSTPANLLFDQSPVQGTIITSPTLVTITVTDEAGNDGTCSFMVTIADTTDPVVNCPANSSMAINSSCEYTLPDYSSMVSGTDNCSAFGDMVITQNPLAGSTENGITNVIITLTDEQGNASTCTTVITPIDNTAPQITCPSPAPVNNGTNCDYVLPYYGSMAPVIDNCSNYTIDQSPVQGTTVQTGATDITLTVTDAGGNTAFCTFALTVIETEAPTITCPSNISTCDPLVNYAAPLFSDNCAVSITQTDNTGLTSGDLFPIGQTTLEYTAMDSSGNVDNCTFIIEILDYPSQATILADTLAICDQTTALIEAEMNTSGTGEWSVLSGTGNLNNQFANQTGVNNLTIGTTQFVWTVSTPACGSTTDTLVLINSAAPSAANTQDTIFACDQSQINLLTATPSSGTGMWSTPQGATIGNAANSATIAFNIPDGWNEFIWTISSPGCASNSDTMHVFKTGNTKVLTADTVMCFDTQVPVNLVGTTPSPEQSSKWEFMFGDGILSNTSGPVTVASQFAFGENVVVYTVKHPLCPSDADTVRILVNYCDGFEPIFPTVITPNQDGKNDVFVISHLEKAYPDCHIVIYNRWGSVVFESTGYEIPWDGTYNGEKLPMGTYFFKLELNDENNTIYNGPISVIH